VVLELIIYDALGVPLVSIIIFLLNMLILYDAIDVGDARRRVRVNMILIDVG
jgi:hypothetical protein